MSGSATVVLGVVLGSLNAHGLTLGLTAERLDVRTGTLTLVGLDGRRVVVTVRDAEAPEGEP